MTTMSEPRRTAFVVLTFTVLFGTLYSILSNSFLDTSDPSIASLPHPLHHQSYFARKSNIFNTIFVKQAWGWTSLAFTALYTTSPPNIRSSRRIAQYVIATLVWASFTSWFFGPAIIDRVVSLSGGQCVITLPSPDSASLASTITVPPEYCYSRTKLSPVSHPELFITPFALPHQDWSVRPRYLKGHDVSGHIFLLTLAVLFLADQLKFSVNLRTNDRTRLLISTTHSIAMWFTFALSALWIWMVYMTSVYWHTPGEKVSGFSKLVIGLIASLTNHVL